MLTIHGCTEYFFDTGGLVSCVSRQVVHQFHATLYSFLSYVSIKFRGQLLL